MVTDIWAARGANALSPACEYGPFASAAKSDRISMNASLMCPLPIAHFTSQVFKKPEERSELRRLPPQMGITWVIPYLSPHTHSRYAAPIAPPTEPYLEDFFWGGTEHNAFRLMSLRSITL